jgi:mercuric ion transport protein
MSGRRDAAAVVGIGAAACAVCCAGPILGVLAAVGLGTAAGLAIFGTAAVVIGIAVIGFVVVRRRRRSAGCGRAASTTAQVELGTTPVRS